MGLERLLKNRFTRNIGLVAGLTAGLLGVGARQVSATVPLQIDGVIAGVADNVGAHGTHWQSTVCALQDEADNVTIRYLPGNKSDPARADRFVQLDVPRGQAICLENALDGFGDFQAPGALFYDWNGIEPSQGSVFSRTWTPRPSDAPGTMGQGILGVDVEDLPLGGDHVVPLAHDADAFRTNVGIANVSAQDSDFTVTMRGSGGFPLASLDVTIPAYGWHQVNDVFDKLGVAPRDHAYVTVRALHWDAHDYVIYSTIIDNTSGDPVFNAGQWRDGTFSPIFVPAAARLPGANDTFWVTDWDIINKGGANGDIAALLFLEENSDNFPGGAAERGYALSSSELLQKDDVVLNEFSLDDTKGALLLSANMDLWTRTFTDQGDGTFGTGLPGLRLDQHAVAGEDYSLLPGLQQSSDRFTGFRTNVGMVNTSTNSIDVTLECYDGSDLVRTIARHLEPWDMQQVNKLYGNTDIANGWVRVTSTATGSGEDTGVIAYASVVDNESGDGYVVLAKRIGPAGPSIDDQIREYLDLYFPPSDARFFMSSPEIYALINGDMGTRSYTLDLATELWIDPVMQGGTTIKGIVEWLEARADGNPDNSEFCPDYDPIQWDNDGLGKSGFVVYDGLGCGPVIFEPPVDSLMRVYDMIKDDFMFNFIKANPELYGGEPGGAPDIDFNPTWNDGNG